MNFSGIGGITIVVVAVLWIFVFIPSWFNSSAEREQEKSQVREVKRAVATARQPILKAPKTKVASLSEQVYRVDRVVAAFKFLTWMFALTAAALGLALNKFGFLLPMVVVAGVLALVSLRALVMARTAQRRLLVGSIRSRTAVTSTVLASNVRAQTESIGQVRAAQQAHRQAEVAAREWAQGLEAARLARQFTVEPIPAPTYAAQVGSLETPVFAKVLDLGEKTAAAAASTSAEPQSVDAEAITEILRRRRASNE
jgi:hypothetical protein